MQYPFSPTYRFFVAQVREVLLPAMCLFYYNNLEAKTVIPILDLYIAE